MEPKSLRRSSRAATAVAPLLGKKWVLGVMAALGVAVGSAAAAPGDAVAWRDLELNRLGKRLDHGAIRRVGRRRVSLGPTRPHVGFEWNRGDRNTEDWYPQGICGLPDQWLLVSWYHKGEGAANKGARLSFVDVSDMSAVRYRHVLLVEAVAGPEEFGVVHSHAGGLARDGDLIYVMNSSTGVRVFDLKDLVEVRADASKSKIGVRGGVPYALNYRYVLKQKRFLPQADLDGPKFSWGAVDWSGGPVGGGPVLVTGNYHRGSEPYDNPPPAMAWWRFEGGGGLTKLADSRLATAAWFPEAAQGGVSRDGLVWVVTSGVRARLWAATYPARSEADFTKFEWAHGTEDLHLSEQSGNLWSLTEHPGHRMVFAVRIEDYQPRVAGASIGWRRRVAPLQPATPTGGVVDGAVGDDPYGVPRAP